MRLLYHSQRDWICHQARRLRALGCSPGHVLDYITTAKATPLTTTTRRING